MHLKSRRKNKNRIVAFQLEPEPGSALEIESPTISPTKSPKKLMKNKVLNLDKLRANQKNFKKINY